MHSFLFRIGTLALLFASLAPASVSHRYARSEPRDQGRADHRPTAEHPPAANTGVRHRSNYCVTCERTPSGRIRRNSSARRAFQHSQPCPSAGSTAGACPGYVVDHIVPLKRGGADAPENMQWQTVQDAKAKDRTE